MVISLPLLPSSINLYEYDSKNKKTITLEFETSIEAIKAATGVEEVETARAKFIAIANQTPTILEDSIKNLPIRIENALNEVDAYITGLNMAEYSEENWNLISKYALETKAYLSENITVNTANVHIEREINNLKSKVMDIMTIEQQRIKDLTEARTNAIKEIKEYEKSLKPSMFEEEIYSLVVERISNCKNIIHSLESIESINKLVRDTIQAVEDAKK